MTTYCLASRKHTEKVIRNKNIIKNGQLYYKNKHFDILFKV